MDDEVVVSDDGYAAGKIGHNSRRNHLDDRPPSLLANEPLINELNPEPMKGILNPSRSDSSVRSLASNSGQKGSKVDWSDPRVKEILEDYKDKGIGSTRVVANRIARLTGVLVSHSTISRQCRAKNKSAKRSFVKDADVYRESVAAGSPFGISVFRNDKDYYDPEDEDHLEMIAFSRAQRCAEKAGSVKYNKNGPVRSKLTTPYYMSFSERFKQTSLTVHMNQEEVRIYRHTSHSRSGRAIYFRCSRCDGINRKLKTGITPRIKMFDGVVIGDMYPEHHPRCKPMNVVMSRLKEIDRHCRKDILSGMDPKEAWEKGKMMALDESSSMNSAGYIANSVIAAYPSWDKCRRLYSTLRVKILRRRMQSGYYDPQKISLHSEKNESFEAANAIQNDSTDVSQYDDGGPVSAKRPRFSNSTNSDDFEEELWDETDGREDLYDDVYGEYEEVDEFVDEFDGGDLDYAIDVANEEEVVTSKTANIHSGEHFARAANVSAASEKATTSATPGGSGLPQRVTVAGGPFVESRPFSRSSQRLLFTQPRNGVGTILDPSFRNSDPSYVRPTRRASLEDDVVLLTPHNEDTSEGTAAAKSEVRGISVRRQQAHYDVTEPLQGAESQSENRNAVSQSGRPRRVIRPMRKLSPLPRLSGPQSQQSHSRTTTFQTKKEKTTKAQKPQEAVAVQITNGRSNLDYVPITTAAGVVSSTVKNRERKYNKHEAQEKLRQIERCIAEYNAFTDNKLAAVLAKREGEMKLFGSKHIVDACLQSKITRRIDAIEESPGDETISVPLLKPRSESEIDAIHASKIGSMLNEFLCALHYPFPNNFDGNRPDYWPSDVRYCNPSKEDTVFKNVRKNPEFRCFDYVVDGQRFVLKYVSRKYLEFLKENFSSSVLSDFESDINLDEADMEPGPSFAGRRGRRSEAEKSKVSQELLNEPTFEEPSTSTAEKGDVARYETMPDDIKEISKLLHKIQQQSSCRGVALFADERCRLTLNGDKTLISAAVRSNFDRFCAMAMKKCLDKEMTTVRLLKMHNESRLDEIPDLTAIDLLEDIMLHLNFPSTDYYGSERPDYWPTEIPFCSPRSDDGKRLLNPEIGVTTPGQAAKMVLKKILRHIRDLDENLNLNGTLIENAVAESQGVLMRKSASSETCKQGSDTVGTETTSASSTGRAENTFASNLPPSKRFRSDSFPSAPYYSRRGESDGAQHHMKSEKATGADASSGQAGLSKASTMKHFLKVFCSCRERGEITSKDCHYCDRCVRYFHDKCLPLKEIDRFYLCVKCAPNNH